MVSPIHGKEIRSFSKSQKLKTREGEMSLEKIDLRERAYSLIENIFSSFNIEFYPHAAASYCKVNFTSAPKEHSFS